MQFIRISMLIKFFIAIVPSRSKNLSRTNEVRRILNARRGRHSLCTHFLLPSNSKCLPKNGSTSVEIRPSSPQYCSPQVPLYSSASCTIPNSFSLCVNA
jgi:hypothetical protein